MYLKLNLWSYLKNSSIQFEHKQMKNSFKYLKSLRNNSLNQLIPGNRSENAHMLQQSTCFVEWITLPLGC